MPTVKFTYALRRFFPELKETEIDCQNLSELMDKVDMQYPGLKNYILDERGASRKHVNIFIDSTLIKDRTTLTDAIDQNTEVYILQALSGG